MKDKTSSSTEEEKIDYEDLRLQENIRKKIAFIHNNGWFWFATIIIANSITFKISFETDDMDIASSGFFIILFSFYILNYTYEKYIDENYKSYFSKYDNSIEELEVVYVKARERRDRISNFIFGSIAAFIVLIMLDSGYEYLFEYIDKKDIEREAKGNYIKNCRNENTINICSCTWENLEDTLSINELSYIKGIKEDLNITSIFKLQDKIDSNITQLSHIDFDV